MYIYEIRSEVRTCRSPLPPSHALAIWWHPSSPTPRAAQSMAIACRSDASTGASEDTEGGTTVGGTGGGSTGTGVRRRIILGRQVRERARVARPVHSIKSAALAVAKDGSSEVEKEPAEGESRYIYIYIDIGI